MRGLYSERLLLANASNQWFGVVIPDGVRAVVKCLSVVGSAEGTTVAEVRIDGSWVIKSSAPVNGGRIESNLMVVAYQGEQIMLAITGAGGFATISGYLLDDDVGSLMPRATRRPYEELALWPAGGRVP